MLRHSLHDKRFVTTGNEHGVSGADTVFHYWTEGPRITGIYQGGRVRTGHLVGRAVGPDRVEMLYHCITTTDELLAGWSRGVVSVDEHGRLRLDFDWAWYTGDQTGGHSHYVELPGPSPDAAAPVA